MQLAHEPDATPFVTADVQHDASAFGRDRRHRGVQLRTAIAAQRAEHITGQALGVRTYEDVLAVVSSADLTHDERDHLGAVEQAAVPDRPPFPMESRQPSLGDALDG